MKFAVLLIFCLFISLTTLNAEQVDRELVLLEIGTGTWCQFCPGAAMGADDLIENGHSVAVIENHNGDNFANTYSNHRNNYYNISSWPTAVFDGVVIVEGGSNTNSMYSNYLLRYQSRIDNPSSFLLDIVPFFDGSSCNATITVNKVDEYESDNITLHFVLTESEILFNWQGQNHLNFVNRLMIPDQFGTSIELATGETQTYDFQFNVQANWVSEHCELVAFLQDENTKEILQGTKIDLIPVINPVSPLEIDFGQVEVGSSSTEQIQITNYWNTELTGMIFSINNFEIESSYSVPPFQTLPLDLTFTPTDAVDYYGAVIITTSNENFLTVAVIIQGSGIEADSDSELLPAATSRLTGNYPNPFNPTTEIEYQLSPDESQATIVIYDLKGQIVYEFLTLPLDHNHSGKVTWNGQNFSGNPLASGIYFAQLNGVRKQNAIKLLLVK